MNPDARENFRRQAEWCAQLGSPFTALVCKVLARAIDGKLGILSAEGC